LPVPVRSAASSSRAAGIGASTGTGSTPPSSGGCGSTASSSPTWTLPPRPPTCSRSARRTGPALSPSSKGCTGRRGARYGRVGRHCVGDVCRLAQPAFRLTRPECPVRASGDHLGETLVVSASTDSEMTADEIAALSPPARPEEAATPEGHQGLGKPQPSDVDPSVVMMWQTIASSRIAYDTMWQTPALGLTA